jgi:recombination protein RecA
MPISKFNSALDNKLREKYTISFDDNPEVVTSGSLMLDFALRKGGIPRGCIIDLFGEEGLGKTTLTLALMAERIKVGEHCAYIDAEHRLNPDLVRIMIPNRDFFHVYPPTDGDAALALLETFVKNNEFKMIAVDSMAAIVPTEMLEEDANPNRPGLIANRITQALRKIMKPVRENGQIVVLINQMRDNMSFFARPGSKKATTINALKFFSSIRMQMKSEALIKNGDEVLGHKLNIDIIKNSFAKPFGKSTMTIVFGEGVDKARDLVDCGVLTGAIVKSGGWFSYMDDSKKGEPVEIKAHGEQELLEKLTPIMDRVLAKVHATMNPTKEQPHADAGTDKSTPKSKE